LLPEIVRRVRANFGMGMAKRGRVQRQLPSLSLYFTDPLSDLIGAHGEHVRRPIQRLSRTVFVCGPRAVVVRYAHKRDLKILQSYKFERIYLLIDDDLEALEEAHGLPVDYRRKLIGYRDGPYRKLMELVTDVVAPSENILKSYTRKRAIHLDPAQCHAAGGLAHHQKNGPFDVVFAATRSHLEDLNHIAPTLSATLKERPDIRLTTFLNGHAPRCLQLPNAIHLPMMEWSRYRAFVAENKFHVAIAPALDTPFNRARSISKVHDHAAFGAAGLYTHQPPFDRIVAHESSGLLLSNDPEQWRTSLLDLSNRRDWTLKIAGGGQALSHSLGDQARVRNFWLRELELKWDDPAA
jgi:hypothetical protein